MCGFFGWVFFFARVTSFARVARRTLKNSEAAINLDVAYRYFWLPSHKGDSHSTQQIGRPKSEVTGGYESCDPPCETDEMVSMYFLFYCCFNPLSVNGM